MLEPFRLNVGYIDVSDDELAALILAFVRIGYSVEKVGGGKDEKSLSPARGHLGWLAG